MKNDHYEEEGRRQAVNEEIEDIKNKENAPSEYKSKGEIVKETSSKLKSFFIDLVEGMVLLIFIYFVVLRRLLPPSGPPHDAPILSDYLFAGFVALAVYAGYFLLKHIIKSQINRGNKE